MNDTAAMLEAHVQFELGRWRGAALEEMVAAEVGALFGWLNTVPLAELVSTEQVIGVVQRVVVDLPITDGLVALIEEGVRAGYDALRDEETTLDELCPRDSYDQFVEVLVAARSIRDVLTTQITESQVYAQLVSHVLYRGIKSYVLTQNVVARRVPGAGSLLRLGRSALSTAGLEEGIDRQLGAFVSGHVQDTLSDSKAFLDQALDDAMIRTIANEVWAANADRTVGWAVDLLGLATLTDAVTAGRDFWLRFRRSDFFIRIVARVVEAFFAGHGEQAAGALLADIGVTEQLVAREITSAVRPALARADASGFLEQRIRAHLGPFYASYAGPVPKPATTHRTTRPR